MKILISGVCGFAGSCIAHGLLDCEPALELSGIDNFSRPGSETNVEPLRKRGVKVTRGDVRSIEDLDALGACDWIIDAAANPSVIAGIDGGMSSREVLENNLYGTINLLELAKHFRAGFIFLSTSRVYSTKELTSLPIVVKGEAFHLDISTSLPSGVEGGGVTEEFSTEPPLSLYGSSKLASEIVALEYGETFGIPVWINRCGVLAGAGQFGRPDQGIFAYWINAYLRRAKLRYIGFDGKGRQTRDCLHPRDLVPVLRAQMTESRADKPRVANFAGGLGNSMSLAELSGWCASRFGAHAVESDPVPRPFDVPWLVLASERAREVWNWEPTTGLESILNEIADHAEAHPDWLQISAPPAAPVFAR
jgi:CDP-paratose 2-epimerase